MGIFRQFPYSNFHDMNMDEILKIMREMQDEWAATRTEWAGYKEFIDNYFATLDVSEEVLAALRTMAADGTLNDILDEPIADAVTAWLAQHVEPTSPAVDNSLSIAGAAADAKATGVSLSAIYCSNSPVSYDKRNSILTVPTGFVLYKGRAWSINAQTIDCNEVSTTYYAWRIKFHAGEGDVANRYVYVEAWNAGEINTDPVIGYIYRDKIKINNLFGTDYNDATGLWITGANDYITYDRVNNRIVYPQSAVFSGGRGIAVTAGYIDLSEYPSPGNARCIYYRVSTNTFVAPSFNQETYSDAVLLGYQYGDKIFINGANTYTVDKFAMIINAANTGDNYYTYDRTTKIFRISGGGFYFTSDGHYANLPAQTVDLTDIQTTAEAYQLILQPDGTITARNWNNTQPFNGWLIGLIYGSTVSVFSQLPVISSDRHVAVFGDSIVAGVGCYRPFHLLLAKFTHSIFKNYGIGSTGYVTNATGSVLAGSGEVGRGSNITASGNNNVQTILSNTTGFESCIIMAGTNDFGSSVPLTTFRTAVGATLDAARNKTSCILVVTPIKRTGYNTANQVGAVLRDYVDIIIEECAARSIRYVDAFNDLNINPNIQQHIDRLLPDGLHLNDVGQNMLAGVIAPAAMANLPILQ